LRAIQAMNRLRVFWWTLSGSLWFVPTVLVLLAVGLAAGLIAAETTFRFDFAQLFPRLFGAGPEGSRVMLAAIAGSMITVAGVVFSVTLVALSLASAQYSPRVIRTFMQDRPTQVVLGVFVAVFVYCLIVIRAVRGGDGGVFVPSLAVFGGMVLALVAIGFLVYFIHHLALAIESSTILARLTEATIGAIDDPYPPLHRPEGEDAAAGKQLAQRISEWVPVSALHSGYIVSVDKAGLARCAGKLGRVVRMEYTTGDFVIEGRVLLSLSSGTAPSPDQVALLDSCFSRDRLRTLEQDVSFGLQQIVDMALRALSPGVNDQSTAIMCIDRIAEVMVRMADRRVEENYICEGATLRLIAADRSYAYLLHQAFNAVCIAAAAHKEVLERLLWALEELEQATRSHERLALTAALIRKVEAALQKAPQ
jgi:uncharacterized membrane protein